MTPLRFELRPNRAVWVREEAFRQARKQLTLGFRRNLGERLVSRFEAKFAPSMLWKNTFRLLAIDGAIAS